MREADFRIDTLKDLIFPGFTDGEDWNSWGCPFFSFEESQRIADALRKFSISTRYDFDEDKFIFEIEDEPEEYSAVVINGGKFYLIGNCVWIWEEVSPIE